MFDNIGMMANFEYNYTPHILDGDGDRKKKLTLADFDTRSIALGMMYSNDKLELYSKLTGIESAALETKNFIYSTIMQTLDTFRREVEK